MNTQVGKYTTLNRSRKPEAKAEARAFSQLEAEAKAKARLFQSQEAEAEAGFQMHESRLHEAKAEAGFRLLTHVW